MSKEMIFDAEARRALCSGFSQLADAVRVTLGPAGRHVALEGPSGVPTLTNDAALIAQEIELADPFENMGAQLAREIHQRAHAEAGDGATTATVLAQALLRHGSKLADRGIHPSALKRGMEAAAQEVLEALRLGARTDLFGFPWDLQAGDRVMAQRIREAMQQVGKNGVVSIASSDSEEEDTVTVLSGCELEQGYLSPYFVTDPDSMECRLEDVWILLVQGKIESFQELIPLLEQVAGSGKALLLVAEDIAGEALATLVVNSLRGNLRLAAVRAPGWGDDRAHQLEDLAVLTGGRVFVVEGDPAPLAGVEPRDLGWARDVTVTKTVTTLRGTGGDAARVADRLRGLERRKRAGSSTRRQRLLTERICRLASNVAVLSVGGSSRSQVHARRGRYQDLLTQALAVRDEGVVTGGGVALLRAGKALPAEGCTDEEHGAAMVKAALAAPLAQIAINAGWNGRDVLRCVSGQADAFGFNAALGVYQDLAQAGVLDAHRVTACALNYAVSMAGMILTTETLVA